MNDATVETGKRLVHPFAQVSKSVLDDDRLSWKSKGIVSYLIGKPDGWKMRVTDIVKHGKEGRDAVWSALNELRAFGYAKMERVRSAGRFSSVKWTVLDYPAFANEASSPRPEKPDTVSPDTVKPDTVKPDTENPHLSNKDSTNNECNEKESRENEVTPRSRSLGKQRTKQHRNSFSENPPKRRPPLSRQRVKPEREEVEAFAKEMGFQKRDGAAMFCKWEGNGWPKGDWKAAFEQYSLSGYLPSQKAANGGSTSVQPPTRRATDLPYATRPR